MYLISCLFVYQLSHLDSCSDRSGNLYFHNDKPVENLLGKSDSFHLLKDQVV